MMERKPLIKFVKKAGSWCLTYWEADGKELKQKQEWFDTEEKARAKLETLK